MIHLDATAHRLRLEARSAASQRGSALSMTESTPRLRPEAPSAAIGERLRADGDGRHFALAAGSGKR